MAAFGRQSAAEVGAGSTFLYALIVEVVLSTSIVSQYSYDSTLYSSTLAVLCITVVAIIYILLLLLF